MNVYHTSSSSVPVQVASAVPVAPTVYATTEAQLPFVGIAGKAMALAHRSFAGKGGVTFRQIVKTDDTAEPKV